MPDIVIKVKQLEATGLEQYKCGALVIAIMHPDGDDAAVNVVADAGIAAFGRLLPL